MATSRINSLPSKVSSSGEPVVSICVVTFNHFQYIQDCLDSILEQEVSFEFEILVSDDASTDGTSEILYSYQSRFPRIIKILSRPKNIMSLGYDVLTDLLKLAKGRYIAFCDGDDFWTSSKKLNSQFRFLIQNRDFLAVAHSTYVFRNGSLSTKQNYWKYHDQEYTLDMADLVGYITPFSLSSFMAERSFIEPYSKMVQDFPASMSGDLRLYLASSMFGKVKVMREFLSAYRVTNTGVCSTSDNRSNFSFYKNRWEMWSNAFTSLNIEEKLFASFIGDSKKIAESVFREVNPTVLFYSSSNDSAVVRTEIKEFRQVLATHLKEFRIIDLHMELIKEASEEFCAEVRLLKLLASLTESVGCPVLLVNTSKIDALTCLRLIFKQIGIVLSEARGEIVFSVSRMLLPTLLCLNRTLYAKRLLDESISRYDSVQDKSLPDVLMDTFRLYNPVGSGVIGIMRQ